jgi:hypothetical protein
VSANTRARFEKRAADRDDVTGEEALVELPVPPVDGDGRVGADAAALTDSQSVLELLLVEIVGRALARGVPNRDQGGVPARRLGEDGLGKRALRAALGRTTIAYVPAKSTARTSGDVTTPPKRPASRIARTRARARDANSRRKQRNSREPEAP